MPQFDEATSQIGTTFIISIPDLESLDSKLEGSILQNRKSNDTIYIYQFN
jgi:hypothetical protein